MRPLKTIEAEAAAATEGPWEVGSDEKEDAATLRAQPRYAAGCDPSRAGQPFGDPVDVIIPFGRAYSDARFIAHARTDVPELCAKVRELHALLVEVRNVSDGDDGHLLSDYWRDRIDDAIKGL